MSLLSVLGSAVLPVVAVAGVGYLLGTARGLSVDPLATVTLYVLAPSLVFHTLVTTPIAAGTVARIGAGVGAFTVAILAVAEAAGRTLGESEPVLGGFVLASGFPNAGNYGIPLSAFAFGAVGRSTAVLYIAAQSVLMYTLGIYVASRGGTGAAAGSVRRVLRQPLVYAVLVALAVRRLGLAPPADGAFMQTVKLTGDAAIPVMLLLLGIQLANSTRGGTVGRVLPAMGIKLLVAPALAVGVALLVGLEGTVGRVFVLECAMPAAVTPLLFTIEFEGDLPGLSAADFVSTAILVSTVASLATLTALIAVLQSGLLV